MLTTCHVRTTRRHDIRARNVSHVHRVLRANQGPAVQPLCVRMHGPASKAPKQVRVCGDSDCGFNHLFVGCQELTHTRRRNTVAGGKKLAVERAVTMYQYPAAAQGINLLVRSSPGAFAAA